MSTLWLELLEELRNLPEIDLLELLEINSDDLLDAFRDKIEQKEDDIRFKLGLEG